MDGGPDVKVEVTYDEQDCAEQVAVLAGKGLIKPTSVFSGP